jgi:hypothetical protein
LKVLVGGLSEVEAEAVVEEAGGGAHVCMDAALLAALSAAKALKKSTLALTNSERMGS